MYYTAWHLERKSSFPIVKVIGETDERNAERSLLSVAILLIKKAQYFDGVPCQEEPIFPNLERGSKVSVSFSIFFKNEKDFVEFTKSFQDNGIT